MPSTLLGLLILVYLLIPGYSYQLVRRRSVPTQRLSTLIGASNIVFVAIVSNSITVALYGIAQLSTWMRNHSPDVARLLKSTEEYVLSSTDRLFYVLGWMTILLIISCTIAIALAFLSVKKPRAFWGIVSPSSTWHHYLSEAAPESCDVIIECVLEDGVTIRGNGLTYNPDVDDSLDRDLTIGPPLTIQLPNDGPKTDYENRLVIVSAHRIVRLSVEYSPSDIVK